MLFCNSLANYRNVIRYKQADLRSGGTQSKVSFAVHFYVTFVPSPSFLCVKCHPHKKSATSAIDILFIDLIEAVDLNSIDHNLALANLKISAHSSVRRIPLLLSLSASTPVIGNRKMMAKEESAKQSLKEKAQAVYDQAPETLKNYESAYIFSSGTATRREFPKYDASEIKSGDLLGSGGFSAVREVLEIELKDDDQTYDVDEEKKKEKLSDVLGHDHNHHYDVSTARTYMAKHTQRHGSARYAIKRLKDDLDEFERARGVLDLAIEVKLMSAFWHPNIGKTILVTKMICMGC